jgi:hypothetical protein
LAIIFLEKLAAGCPFRSTWSKDDNVKGHIYETVCTRGRIGGVIGSNASLSPCLDIDFIYGAADRAKADGRRTPAFWRV